jgi:hypothetical protein
MNPAFPQPEWFLALGRRMEAEGERFRRLGYAEVRFAIAVMSEDGARMERVTGLEIAGYQLTRAVALDSVAEFDPDFIICARDATWQRMLDEIARTRRPELRHTLNSLALIGDELWLQSADQLREDKFYRFNQTLQELFNLAAPVSK